jgi:hypothetical protein
MSLDSPKPPWFDIAEQASKEPDSRKLFALVEQLCDVLDGKTQPRRNPTKLTSTFEVLTNYRR